MFVAVMNPSPEFGVSPDTLVKLQYVLLSFCLHSHLCFKKRPFFVCLRPKTFETFVKAVGPFLCKKKRKIKAASKK